MLAIYDIRDAAERKIAQQALQLRPRRPKVRIVGQSRLPVKAHPRMVRIELPRVQIENRGPIEALRPLEIRATQTIWVNPKVRPARNRHRPAAGAQHRDGELPD